MKARAETLSLQKKLKKTLEDLNAGENRIKELEKEMEEKNLQVKEFVEKEGRVASLEAELSSTVTVEELKMREIKRNILLDVLEELKAREDAAEARENMVKTS